MCKSENVYTDKDNRIIYLSDEIDETSAGKINYFLLSIIEKDNKADEKEKEYIREPIKFYINSCGGYVRDMWGIVDIMINSKTPIYTYCTGYSDSSAFLIFLAGDKRYMNKHSRLVYHQVSGGTVGKIQDMIEDVDNTLHAQNQIEEYVYERCPKINKEKLEYYKSHKKDWYIYLEEAESLEIVAKENKN